MHEITRACVRLATVAIAALRVVIPPRRTPRSAGAIVGVAVIEAMIARRLRCENDRENVQVWVMKELCFWTHKFHATVVVWVEHTTRRRRTGRARSNDDVRAATPATSRRVGVDGVCSVDHIRTFDTYDKTRKSMCMSLKSFMGACVLYHNFGCQLYIYY